MQVSQLSSHSVPGRYWHVEGDGRVQCDLCPRKCLLADGQRGQCYVRVCRRDQIFLTTYGRSSGFCVDPIENKPLNHFLPGTNTLSFGAAGCNLTCRYCPNWDTAKARRTDALASESQPESVAASALEHQCSSIALTYNDPVILLEHAVDVANACRAQGISSVAVTAGYINAEPRAEFFGAMDAAKIDLKAFSEAFYRDICGGQLGTIKDTLCYLVNETSVWVEISSLLIPDENDSDQEICAMCEWIGAALGPDVPLHFTSFVPAFQMLNHLPTPEGTLARARRRALESGLHFVYTDSGEDGPGGITYCSHCAAPLIRRQRRNLLSTDLDESGHCPHCNTPCPGVFAGQATAGASPAAE